MSESEIDILERVAERIASDPPVTRKPEEDTRESQPRRVFALPGILGPTRVTTNFGEVPAHLVRERDYLRTKDHGFLQVLRIIEYKMDEGFLKSRPDAKPVTIPRAALGPNTPVRPVHLSPGQMVLKPVKGVQHDLIPAATANARSYAFEPDGPGITYYVFQLDRPTYVRCEGMWVEMAIEADAG